MFYFVRMSVLFVYFLCFSCSLMRLYSTFYILSISFLSFSNIICYIITIVNTPVWLLESRYLLMKKERHARIIEIMQNQNIITIKDLAQQLNCTEMTVRRNLD